MALLHSLLAPLCLVLIAVQFALIGGLSNRLRRTSRSMRAFFTTPAGEDIESLLRETLEQSRLAAMRCEELGAEVLNLNEVAHGALQYIGLRRYDAFGDVTGQQSFSLALLDGRDNGAIITALFGRTTSRCYGKMILGGRPEQPLTEEEQQALMAALEQKVGAKR